MFLVKNLEGGLGCKLTDRGPGTTTSRTRPKQGLQASFSSLIFTAHDVHMFAPDKTTDPVRKSFIFLFPTSTSERG